MENQQQQQHHHIRPKPMRGTCPPPPSPPRIARCVPASEQDEFEILQTIFEETPNKKLTQEGCQVLRQIIKKYPVYCSVPSDSLCTRMLVAKASDLRDGLTRVPDSNIEALYFLTDAGLFVLSKISQEPLIHKKQVLLQLVRLTKASRQHSQRLKRELCAKCALHPPFELRLRQDIALENIVRLKEERLLDSDDDRHAHVIERAVADVLDVYSERRRMHIQFFTSAMNNNVSKRLESFIMPALSIFQILPPELCDVNPKTLIKKLQEAVRVCL